jgi:hypothetical protein
MTGQRVRSGDVIEAALWFDPSRLSQETSARLAIERALHDCADEANAIVGPPRWEILTPGDRRLPDPPADAPRGVKCLVGHCIVLALADERPARRFALELDANDLARFRAITRRAWAARYPSDPPLTDHECDDWIERYGPDAAANVVRRACNA